MLQFIPSLNKSGSFLWVWAGLIVFFFGCKSEKEFNPVNKPPTIRISIDSIGLPDTVRLVTRMKMNWTGEDGDGYVQGYKVFWSDKEEGNPTERLSLAPMIYKTDSVFLFNFSGSTDKANIYFYVQAIDDKGLASNPPAFLKIPVKNSNPTIGFLKNLLPKADSIWSVITLPYAFDDPDGVNNIDSVYLKINDGEWVNIPKNLSFISVVPEDPAATGVTNALIYSGDNLARASLEPMPIAKVKVPGLALSNTNRFYLKVKDLAGATGLDTTKSYFFQRKTSDLLLIDACRQSTKDSMYTEVIRGIQTYDRIDLNFPVLPGSKAGINQPVFWNASFYLMCKLYKKIFWYSDEFPSSQPPGTDTIRTLLSSSAPSFNQYLRFNGKLLISAKFEDGRNKLFQDDAVFSLLPIDSIYTRSDTIRIRPGGIAIAKQPGYQDLKVQTQAFTGTIVTGVDIFHPKPGVDTLYVLPKATLGGSYKGTLPMPIALRSRNGSNTNLVFFGMEMFNLSLDRQALSNTFSKILNEEFNW